MELWRCDVCHDLIDPVEEDVRTVLQVALKPEDGAVEQDHLDLCEECRPQSLGAHIDFLTWEMEDE